MKRIILLFLLLFSIQIVYADDIDYKGKYTKLTDALLTGKSGVYLDTVYVLVIDDIGKMTLSYRLDTLAYSRGKKPKASISFLVADSSDVAKEKVRFLYPQSGKPDTLIDSIKVTGRWYGAKLDTLPAVKLVAFIIRLDSAQTDSSIYRIFLNVTQK